METERLRQTITQLQRIGHVDKRTIKALQDLERKWRKEAYLHSELGRIALKQKDDAFKQLLVEKDRQIELLKTQLCDSFVYISAEDMHA